MEKTDGERGRIFWKRSITSEWNQLDNMERTKEGCWKDVEGKDGENKINNMKITKGRRWRELAEEHVGKKLDRESGEHCWKKVDRTR